MTDLFSVVIAVDVDDGLRQRRQMAWHRSHLLRWRSHLLRRRCHLHRMKSLDVVDDVKAALLPAGPLAGGDGFLLVQLRTALGCFVRHGVGHGVGPPSHGALGYLNGGKGAAAGSARRVVRHGRRKLSSMDLWMGKSTGRGGQR